MYYNQLKEINIWSDLYTNFNRPDPISRKSILKTLELDATEIAVD